MKQKSLIVRQGFSEEESGFLECRGREIRTPDLLLPKQALTMHFIVEKQYIFYPCVHFAIFWYDRR